MTAEQRRTLISMWQAGVAHNRVALQMIVSRSTVSKPRFWRRFMETGSRAKKARSGRPKITLRKDRMQRVVQQQRFQSLGAVNRMWNERISKVISLSTVKRRIRRQSLYSIVARRKPLIGPNNRYSIYYDGTTFLVGMCMHSHCIDDQDLYRFWWRSENKMADNSYFKRKLCRSWRTP